MYSAETRATYAKLFKMAASALPARIGEQMVNAAHGHPLIASSMYSAVSGAKGTR